MSVSVTKTPGQSEAATTRSKHLIYGIFARTASGGYASTASTANRPCPQRFATAMQAWAPWLQHVAKGEATLHVRSVPKQQILGIGFFDGAPVEAVKWMMANGGFLIAPSGTCFARLGRDAIYRDAVTHADVALPDSGAMVLFWRFLRHRRLTRISGFKYLRELTTRLFAEKAKLLWVLPNERARRKTADWLTASGVSFGESDFYVAPIYGKTVEDRKLLDKLERDKPQHVIVAIGSGPQEKLGYYLRENLSARPASVRPAIHCIGAALGFLTGDQVAIPEWADRVYLGWLFRLIAQPRIFIPRLTRALELPWLIARYGEQLPPLRSAS